MGKEAAEMKTTPYDPRFPNTNQTRHCYFGFVDFQKCSKKLGENAEPCQYFKRMYKSMCPNEWVDKWSTEIDEGVFPREI